MERVNEQNTTDRARATIDPAWTAMIPREQADALVEATSHLERAGVHALLGGAFAIGRHVGRWRGTKDIDFFVRPAQRQAAIDALLKAGFKDYHEQLAYDRSWIFRAFRDNALIDIIWTIPNHVTDVDDEWFARAASFPFEGRRCSTVPLEELIWIKLFVLQRDRCDWPDVINLLRRNAKILDWERLIDRLDDHEPLLIAVLQVLDWLAPAVVTEFPTWVLSRFHLRERPQVLTAEEEARRAALLDSRPWYAELLSGSDVMAP